MLSLIVKKQTNARLKLKKNLFCRLQTGLQDKGYEEWVGEMIGMREILKNFANVTKSEVVGMRAPYLKPGRNTQYKVSRLIIYKKLNMYL